MTNALERSFGKSGAGVSKVSGNRHQEEYLKPEA